MAATRTIVYNYIHIVVVCYIDSVNYSTFLTKIDVGDNIPVENTINDQCHAFFCNYNSLAAVGLVAVCEISIMICEIASVNDMLRNDDATSIASYHRYFADWL